ncbi:hypothetical protein [Achromobacter sp.]|uniref:hypothetical protein n=1 Tax=Achromobacter sp. TaxID=134375 RepID=UPI00289CC455|nr:hypothetical protein [Achromobacter sp.]
MMLRPFHLLLAALALSPALHAQPAGKGAAWTPPGPTACRFSGWTTNDKPAIPVRASASGSGKQVGALPTTRGDSPDPEVDLYSVIFDVTEARDGWLKIKNASDAMSGSDRSPPRPVYQGEGWIAAGDAQVGIQSARGYARPDAGSERLLDLGHDWLTERATLRGIVACDGEWLLLDYEMRNSATWERLAEKDRTRGRAWFRGVCASSETTCDMRSVDQ